ncbi:uncharacterized protein TNCV_3307281 [Trichonephila clavipes]|nr:uncharacterized protein TNCV_3307281 [Trichonephila clavipes]
MHRIQWVGHVVRMNEDRTTKKVFNVQPSGIRIKDSSNLKWIDGLQKNLVLRTKNWRTLTGRRLTWKRLLEKTKAPSGMSSFGGKKKG